MCSNTNMRTKTRGISRYERNASMMVSARRRLQLWSGARTVKPLKCLLRKRKCTHARKHALACKHDNEHLHLTGLSSNLHTGAGFIYAMRALEPKLNGTTLLLRAGGSRFVTPRITTRFHTHTHTHTHTQAVTAQAHTGHPRMIYFITACSCAGFAVVGEKELLRSAKSYHLTGSAH
jgi:hypothetical protein